MTPRGKTELGLVGAGKKNRGKDFKLRTGNVRGRNFGKGGSVTGN